MLFDYRENFISGDGSAIDCTQADNHAGSRRSDLVLHLHSLDDHQSLITLDSVALGYEYPDEFAWHGRNYRTAALGGGRASIWRQSARIFDGHCHLDPGDLVSIRGGTYVEGHSIKQDVVHARLHLDYGGITLLTVHKESYAGTGALHRDSYFPSVDEDLRSHGTCVDSEGSIVP